MIRLFFSGLIILFFTIGQIGILIVEIIRIFDKNLSYKFYRQEIRILLKILIFISGVDIVFDGLDKLKKDETYLFIGNHRSIFDFMISYCYIKNYVSYIAKIELSKILFFGFLANRIEILFLDRNDIRQALKVLISAIDLIKDNRSIFIFPEGTRNKNDNPLDLYEFKAGSFKIAEKTKCKIVPIAFYGTEKIFEKQKPFIKKSKVYIKIGNIHSFDNLTDEEKKHIDVYEQKIIYNLLKEIVEKNI